jgi:hypothetical protein
MAAQIVPRLESADDRLTLSDGEMQFLWWFIQGSIMNPDTRERLRSAWGMCARHATALVAVEAAYRHGWMRACALLYVELIERGVNALVTRGFFGEERAIHNLRATAPCLMCELSVGRATGGAASPDLLARHGDGTQLETFARETEAHWRALVCRACDKHADGPLCRPHLIIDHPFDLSGEIRQQRARLGYIARHLIRYARSSRPEQRDIDTPEHRAALIEAVGWCSGWSPVLVIVGGRS